MKLWKENRLDQEYELPDEEVVKRFLTWAETHQFNILDRALADFICSKEGLNSSFEIADLDRIFGKALAEIKKSKKPSWWFK